MIGKWRITEMGLWDSEFIDLLGPGYIQFSPNGGGEFVFGAVQGGLDCHYGPASIPFIRAGHDEIDEASGDGNAQLEEDAAITGDIRFHLGDKSAFTAKRWQLFRSLLGRPQSRSRGWRTPPIDKATNGSRVSCTPNPAARHRRSDIAEPCLALPLLIWLIGLPQPHFAMWENRLLIFFPRGPPPPIWRFDAAA